MKNSILFSISAFLCIVWGIAHLFPVKSVVKDFGGISEDNKRIVYMEWINEGFTLIFIGILITVISIWGNPYDYIQKIILFLVCFMLMAMAVLSLFTGFKIKFLPFKLCPVIFSSSALLILLGLLFGRG
jgi:hypothetical protein